MCSQIQLHAPLPCVTSEVQPIYRAESLTFDLPVSRVFTSTLGCRPLINVATSPMLEADAMKSTAQYTDVSIVS